MEPSEAVAMPHRRRKAKVPKSPKVNTRSFVSAAIDSRIRISYVQKRAVNQQLQARAVQHFLDSSTIQRRRSARSSTTEDAAATRTTSNR